MSQTIRVTDDVFRRLQRLQGPRETYSDVVERLLSVAEAWQKVTNDMTREAITQASLIRDTR